MAREQRVKNLGGEAEEGGAGKLREYIQTCCEDYDKRKESPNARCQSKLA